MPMVGGYGDDPSQDVLAQGAATLGAYFAAQIMDKRDNKERTVVEEQIRNAPDFQSALTIIEQAPPRVKSRYEPELLERARARFPEQELMSVLDAQGRIANIPHEKGKPLSDEDIRARGFNPARQFVVVSTDEEGNIELHDSALGEEAANEDLARFQEMFPKRRLQLAQGPETEVFMNIRDQQLRAMEDRTRRDTSDRLSVAEQQMIANVQAEIANDPLATENGAVVLESHRDAIAQRFKDYNGKFAGDVFSLDSPESAALVQNGIGIASTAIVRGANLEKATNLGFNAQIANSIISNLLKQNQPDSALAEEAEKRFGVNVETLRDKMQKVVDSSIWQEIEEYTPDNTDVATIPVPGIDGKPDILLRFVKVNGKIVPLDFRRR